MQPHQERVVTEKKELDEKIDTLEKFIESSPIFRTLPVAERQRLTRQLAVMQEYSYILGLRIEAFPQDSGTQ